MRFNFRSILPFLVIAFIAILTGTSFAEDTPSVLDRVAAIEAHDAALDNTLESVPFGVYQRISDNKTGLKVCQAQVTQQAQSLVSVQGRLSTTYTIAAQAQVDVAALQATVAAQQARIEALEAKVAALTGPG